MGITPYDLNDIIENKKIKTVFQPIISLRDSSVLGYEALSRITDDNKYFSIEELFDFSIAENRTWDLEHLCRTTALKTAYEKLKPPIDKKLFLNVNPNIMHDNKFRQGFTKEYLEKFKITPENIIFEITEKSAITNMSDFLLTVSHYKKQKYMIAIDDVGAGYSGLNLISDIKPHYIKIDMKLIRNIHLDNLKYSLVKSMLELSYSSNINIIAEGIETEDELLTLINLGVQYGQGYFIKIPDENIAPINDNIINIIESKNSKKNRSSGRQASDIYIDNLRGDAISVSPNTKVEQVYNILKSDLSSQGLCVTENGEVVGVVMKNKLIVQLSGRYGFSLNQKKKISHLMDTDFLSVDYMTPISVVSHIATLRKQENIYDFVVITKDGKFYGTVSVKDILQKITDIELQNAKNQNPLTGLPGNSEIENRLSSCLKCGINYTVMYIDIDNFKAYNDVYGFEQGDKVIINAAKILKNLSYDNTFVGHIGGDDFVVIGNFNKPEEICRHIINSFESLNREFYNEVDFHNKFIISKNRKGKIEKFPLLSLSVSGIKNISEKYDSIYDLSEALAKLKKTLKQSGGNDFLLM